MNNFYCHFYGCITFNKISTFSFLFFLNVISLDEGHDNSDGRKVINSVIMETEMIHLTLMGEKVINSIFARIE